MKKSFLFLSMMFAAGFILPANAQNYDDNVAQASAQASTKSKTYTQEEITNKAAHFFGETTGGLGKAIEHVFKDQGEPVGYIEGSEGSVSLAFGLRYGRGTLVMKNGERRPVFWQGPSFGFDTGANASKVFTLVYNLGNPDGIYRRYPGVEGAAYFVAGVSATYQRAEGVTLAPIRTGVGFRAGANAGYTAYSKKRRVNPF